MASMGTFGAFTAARMGLYASQAALNVTGNNIANINTQGYTRQRVDLVSLGSYSVDQYASPANQSFGQGVLVDSISQVRDQFLDIRFRDEQTQVGQLDAKYDVLTELSSILDEVAKGDGDFGVIEAQINEIVVALQNLSEKAGSVEYDTLVRSAASTLTQLFNTYAEKLETVQENLADQLNQETDTVNVLLSNIQSLNEQIRTAGIYGDNALELRDQRNLYIDELSEFVGIDVVYSMESLDQYTEIQKLSIYIEGTDIALVDGLYIRQFQLEDYTNVLNPDYIAPGEVGADAGAGQYLDDYGNPTDDLNLAAPWRNPAYDTDDTAPRYIASYDPITNTYEYTSVATSAGLQPNPAFDASVSSNNQYLDADGEPTNDSSLAAQLPNNIDGEMDNEFLYTLSPLVDLNGKIMTDSYRRPMDEDIYLSDVLLSGALQGTREMLTEEGEYSSNYDISIDPDATIKRGIPYYQSSLDALAKKFAETLNEANRVTPDEIFTYNDLGQFVGMVPTGDVDEFGMPTYEPLQAMDSDGNLLYKDADGNLVTDPLEGDPYYITIYNMYDAVPGSENGKTFEDQIYAYGNFEEDYYIDNGHYMTPMLDDDGNYVYGTEGQQLFEFLKGDDGVNVTILNASSYLTEIERDGFSQADYDPLDMFEIGEDENGVECFVDELGEPIYFTRTDVNGSVDVLLTPSNVYSTYGLNVIVPPDTAAASLPSDEQVNFFQYLQDYGTYTEDYQSLETSGVLFSNSSKSNDTTNITAANISISQDWSTGTVRIVLSKEVDAGSTDNSNVLHMISLMDKGLEYNAADVRADAASGDTTIFTGSFQEQLANMTSTLAQDTQTTGILLDNYSVSALTLDNYRLSVSGVDLNDEASNMMQFQASYSASARMVTVLDEVLNTLIHMAQ
ncbi:MAG: flagellar basal body rod C-terminal domain-containing protein [Eubacteriales bacterium]